jgi:hypothetical protein
MYEIAMANGLIDIVHIPKPHKVVAATEDGKQIPFQVLQVSSFLYVFHNLHSSACSYLRHVYAEASHHFLFIFKAQSIFCGAVINNTC